MNQQSDSNTKIKLYSIIGAGALILLILVIVVIVKLEQSPSSGGTLSDTENQRVQTLLMKDHDYQATLTESAKLLASYPNSSDLWLYKGTAEFFLSNYQDAKSSMERVLMLDPNNESAKNYLQQIILFSTQNVYRFDPKDALTQEAVEKKVGVELDAKSFKFVSGTPLTAPTATPFNFTAAYSTKLNLKEAVASIKKTLDKAGEKYEVQVINGTTVLAVRKAGTAQGDFLGYSITINGIQVVDVSVYYNL